MFALWSTIKTLRAGAYFKNALDNDSNNKLKQTRKTATGISSKVLLSGIIFAATLALSGRTAYRAFKKIRNKSKAKKLQKEKANANKPTIDKIPTSQPSYSPSNGYSGNNNNSANDILPTSEDRLRQSSVMTKTKPEEQASPNNDTNYKKNPFSNDNFFNDWQEQSLKNLQLFKINYNDSYPGTLCLNPSDQSYQNIYFNDSGLWSLDENNNKILLLENNKSDNNMIYMSLLSTQYNNNYLEDICTLYDILNLK